MSNLTTAVRSVTLLVAEVVFVLLIFKIVLDTWSAGAGAQVDVPSVQVAAAGALAVALGGGFAALLGVPSSSQVANSFGGQVQAVLNERRMLALGVIAYMVAGFAACITYGLNEKETPEVLRTIAIAFGGYVVAFVGSAMRQISD